MPFLKSFGGGDCVRDLWLGCAHMSDGDLGTSLTFLLILIFVS